MATVTGTSFASPDSRHSVFVTDSLCRAREHLDRTLQPAIYRTPIHARFDYAFQNFARLAGRVAFSYVRLGGTVQIQPGLLRDFYLVQIPRKGYADIEYGGKHIQITPSQWSLLSPVEPVFIGWSPDCELLEIKIERVALEAMLADLAGVSVVKPIEFDLAFRREGGRAASMFQLVSYICNQLELPRSPIGSSAACTRLEDFLLAMVLESQRHNYSEVMNERGSCAGELPPKFIQRAIEYIVSHADETVRLADIATASGKSVRVLNAGFRKYQHLTPMEFLRNRRLDNARAALEKAADSSVTVTQIAHQWRLHHLGRFARNYKRRFGESPSTTLKRSRSGRN